MTRRHFCDGLNDQAEKDHPFPEELKYTLDLTFSEGLDENGNDRVPYEPLLSGIPSLSAWVLHGIYQLYAAPRPVALSPCRPVTLSPCRPVALHG